MNELVTRLIAWPALLWTIILVLAVVLILLFVGWFVWEAKHAPHMNDYGEYLDQKGHVTSKAAAYKAAGRR